MTFLEGTRSIVARIISELPYVRGMGSAWTLLNRLFLKLGAERFPVVRMRNGSAVRLDLRSQYQVNAYYRRQYDAHSTDLMTSLFEPDQTFLDVGANIGFYTLAVGNFIKNANGLGQVIAFEPHPGNFARLSENVEINGLGKFCVAHQLGLSNLDGDVIITLHKDTQGGLDTGNASIVLNQDYEEYSEKLFVPVNRLDSIWPAKEVSVLNSRIDFIKVDIEGHEDFFLQGAVDTLNANRPTILMEVNKPYYEARGVDMDDRILSLVPKDYHVYRYDGFNWQRLRSLQECRFLDDVLLVPAERSGKGRYAEFS